MIDRVIFLSQPRAETVRPPRDTALISITDTDMPPATLGTGWADILRLSFDDIDPVTYPDDHGWYEDTTEIHAYQMVQVAEFCLAVADRCRRLVVHCRYGQSRSAAIAKALCEVRDLPFPPDYDGYNNFVYRTVLGAMRQAFSQPGVPGRA